jgi:hypothetical protein
MFVDFADVIIPAMVYSIIVPREQNNKPFAFERSIL